MKIRAGRNMIDFTAATGIAPNGARVGTQRESELRQFRRAMELRGIERLVKR
jgi:hypothetical protein